MAVGAEAGVYVELNAKVHIDEKQKIVELEMKASALGQSWLEAAAWHKRSPQDFTWMTNDQGCTATHEAGYSNGGDGFYGSYDEAVKTISSGSYFNKRFQTDTFRNIKNLIPTQFGHQRRRAFSDTDGEWTPDRMWDIKPFATAMKQPKLKRVEIECDFSIPCSAKKDSVTNYGVFCFNIVKRLEELGFVCDVSITTTSHNLYRHNGINYMKKAKYFIKRSGEYQLNANFARFFTDWFYRRCIFWSRELVGQKIGFKTQAGYGKSHKQGIEVRKGFIKLVPSATDEIVARDGQINEQKLRDIFIKAIGD